MGVYFIDEAIRRAATAGHLKSAGAKAEAGFLEGWRAAADTLLLNFVDLFGDEPSCEAAREFLEMLKKECLGAKIALSEIYGCDLIDLP